MNDLLDEVAWNDQGLVPAIAQDHKTGQVLMLAWMNRDALRQSIELQEAVYWSRSRQNIWHKGESSGHRQHIVDLRLDCDGDCVLMRVEQIGGIACHTGREHCFFRRHTNTGWQNVEPVRKDPSEIYSKKP